MAEIPIFPLPLVFFPRGVLPLQVFEPRYLDMVKRCLRGDSGFGVALIEEGDQVLPHAEAQLPVVHHCGTYGLIADFDQNSRGTLGIKVRGCRKFVIRDQYEQPDRLMMADVSFLDEEAAVPLPEDKEHLIGMLETFIQHETLSGLDLEIDYSSAREIGWRLSELMPCDNRLKQRLLEMRDPLARLDELEKMIMAIQQARG